MIRVDYTDVNGKKRWAIRDSKQRPLFVKWARGKREQSPSYKWLFDDGDVLQIPDSAWRLVEAQFKETHMLTAILNKLQAAGQVAKSVLLWILTPLLVVAGIIWVLVSKNKTLQNQVDMLQSNGKVQADETQDATATKEAITSLDNYKQLRDEYLASQKPPTGKT